MWPKGQCSVHTLQTRYTLRARMRASVLKEDSEGTKTFLLALNQSAGQTKQPFHSTEDLICNTLAVFIHVTSPSVQGASPQEGTQPPTTTPRSRLLFAQLPKHSYQNIQVCGRKKNANDSTANENPKLRPAPPSVISVLVCPSQGSKTARDLPNSLCLIRPELIQQLLIKQ